MLVSVPENKPYDLRIDGADDDVPGDEMDLDSLASSHLAVALCDAAGEPLDRGVSVTVRGNGITLACETEVGGHIDVQLEHGVYEIEVEGQTFVADSLRRADLQHEGGAPYEFQLYVGEIAPPAVSADWPWDEALWTQKMRDIIADVRATPTPTGPLERWQITQYGVKDVEPGDVEVRSASGEVFGTVSRRSLMSADIEGTMRLDGRILNITKAENVYEPREVEVDGHKIIKRKPVEEKFDPANSLWTDVTEKYPWGAGSRTPLVPFRTLAINPHKNPTLYFKKVYINQLDGLVLPTGETHNGICVVGDAGGMDQQHFDLCVGREDSHIKIPSVAKRGHTMCEIQLLDESAVAKPTKRKKK